MNAYFVGITQQEKNNILDQHKKIYDGYRLVQQNNTEPQPLYVQDFANDKEGFVVNNKGDVKKYTNMGINESQEDFETMEMEEDDCVECGMKETYEDMDYSDLDEDDEPVYEISMDGDLDEDDEPVYESKFGMKPIMFSDYETQDRKYTIIDTEFNQFYYPKHIGKTYSEEMYNEISKKDKQGDEVKGPDYEVEEMKMSQGGEPSYYYETTMKETYEDMDQPSEEDFQEIGFEFEKPITIRGNVYHNTGDLERGENINLGSIMNTEDGLRFMSMSNKPEGLTLDELVDLLNHEEVMNMDDAYAYRDDMDMHPEVDEIDLEDLDAASEFYDKLKSGEGQKPSDRLNKPSDEEDNNWMFVEDEFTESKDLDESFYTQRNKILEMFQRTARF